MTATLMFNGVPTCPICKHPIALVAIEDGEEVYKCKCGLCDERKPEVKNGHD